MAGAAATPAMMGFSRKSSGSIGRAPVDVALGSPRMQRNTGSPRSGDKSENLNWASLRWSSGDLLARTPPGGSQVSPINERAAGKTTRQLDTRVSRIAIGEHSPSSPTRSSSRRRFAFAAISHRASSPRGSPAAAGSSSPRGCTTPRLGVEAPSLSVGVQRRVESSPSCRSTLSVSERGEGQSAAGIPSEVMDTPKRSNNGVFYPRLGAAARPKSPRSGASGCQSPRSAQSLMCGLSQASTVSARQSSPRFFKAERTLCESKSKPKIALENGSTDTPRRIQDAVLAWPLQEAVEQALQTLEGSSDEPTNLKALDSALLTNDAQKSVPSTPPPIRGGQFTHRTTPPYTPGSMRDREAGSTRSSTVSQAPSIRSRSSGLSSRPSSAIFEQFWEERTRLVELHGRAHAGSRRSHGCPSKLRIERLSQVALGDARGVSRSPTRR
eukprot:TRINITY_DN17679_c0_g1_i1.p1 TRINITY_DN17679_c0_g1~~TRINITY_DN17679_c0_g1_i1.p1  ORF type:complete len:440 (-),score=54.50 TRINITY_DN17679_c0_g1_i1:184-1503(-)